VEFASDLCEFIKKDLKRIGHGLAEDFKIVLVEAGEVLGTFDRDLRQYASGNLQKIGVEIKRAAVEKVYQHEVVLSGGERLDYGLLVWSTGVGPTPLTLVLSRRTFPDFFI
jgi:NADH dehydrogenase FAD-containing subunit